MHAKLVGIHLQLDFDAYVNVKACAVRVIERIYVMYIDLGFSINICEDLHSFVSVTLVWILYFQILSNFIEPETTFNYSMCNHA